MTEKQHKRCPFCGGTASIKIHDFFDDTRLYTPKCKCGAEIVGAFHTEAEAWRAWDRRYGEGERCANCRHYVVGGKVDYCELIRYARNTDDYCSRWEEA